MSLGKCLIMLAMGAGALPAAAAVTIVGNSSARSCYEAALYNSSAVRSALDTCTYALEQESLTQKDRVATHVNRGIVRMHGRDLAAAIDDFNRAIALDPDQAEAYLNKAVATSHLQGGWARSLPLFDKAIEKRTRKPALAYYGRAVAHEMTGNIRAAYNDYRQASILAPDWADPKVELSRFTFRRP
jgi:tetratricopeptide (TPR) repeat protein